MGQADGKYWVANNPNSEVTDAQAQKIAAAAASAIADYTITWSANTPTPGPFQVDFSPQERVRSLERKAIMPSKKDCSKIPDLTERKKCMNYQGKYAKKKSMPKKNKSGY